MNRRDFAWLLPVLSAMPAAGGEAAPSGKGAEAALSGKGAEAAPAEAQAFRFADLPAKTNAEGNVTRAVLKGDLPTGEFLEVHETALAAGKMPHPPHRHQHSELMLIRTGQVQLILDGKTEMLGPGDIAWCASQQLHGLKNTGSEPANYFVIAIGPDLRPAPAKSE